MGYRLGICHLNYFLAGLLSAGRCSYILLTGLCKQRPWFLRTSPAHLTTTWNGLLCIVLSLAAAKLWAKLAKRPQGDLSMFSKITLAFVFLGISYIMLVMTELTRGVGAPSSVKGNVMWIFLFGIFLTIGEICFSPLGNSFVSKYAPKKYLSVLMGVWT